MAVEDQSGFPNNTATIRVFKVKDFLKKHVLFKINELLSSL